MPDEFSDPELHRALGEVCLNFALLESAVSITLAALCEIAPPAVSFPLIWSQHMRFKIDTLADVAKYQGAQVPQFGTIYDEAKLKEICGELREVNTIRNAIVHGFWTVEIGPLLSVNDLPFGPGFEARAEVIRPVVNKFGRQPTVRKSHFPSEELPELLARIENLLPTVSRLGSDFCRLKAASLQP